jgi:hypothetical protein
MARQDKLLARMRRNPRGDWRIEQLKAIADQHDIPFRQPGSSHVIFVSTRKGTCYRIRRAGRSSRCTFASSWR